MAEGDTLRIALAALRRLLKVSPVNTIAIRRDELRMQPWQKGGLSATIHVMLVETGRRGRSFLAP